MNMILNSLRNKSFWVKDYLQGNPVKKHLKEINTIQSNPKSNEAIHLKEGYINTLIEHALTSTEYYKKWPNAKVIQDFPVINKAVIRDNFNAFESVEFKEAKTHKVSTSGSTGLSFFLFQNRNKRYRNSADGIYFYDLAHYTFGNKIYKLIVWHNNNKKSNFQAWLINMYQYDVSHFDEKHIEEFINVLKTDTSKNGVLQCYASALELIAKYLETNNIDMSSHGLNSVVAMSEYLNDFTKTTLENRLDIPVLSRYSNEEMGMIAQQFDQSSNLFKINHASYYVEVLKIDSDLPAEEGELGRIVITDLHNLAMPIIRYDTGDLASFKLVDDVMYFDQVVGRKMDVIHDTNGNFVSSFITHAIFNEFYQYIQQYQLIQQGQKEYEVRLNIGSNTFEFENDLLLKIKHHFGDDAEIKIIYVDEIPALASGKRRKVINNYIKK